MDASDCSRFLLSTSAWIFRSRAGVSPGAAFGRGAKDLFTRGKRSRLGTVPITWPDHDGPHSAKNVVQQVALCRAPPLRVMSSGPAVPCVLSSPTPKGDVFSLAHRGERKRRPATFVKASSEFACLKARRGSQTGRVAQALATAALRISGIKPSPAHAAAIG